MHRNDVEVRKLNVGVVSLDGLVVPLLDVASEDLREGVGRELEILHAVELVDNRDRGDVDGDVESLAAEATILRLGNLFILEVGIRAGEVGGGSEELLATLTRANSVVGHRGARVLSHEATDERTLCVFHRGSAGTGEGARDVTGCARRALGVFALAFVGGVATARCESEGACEAEGGCGNELLLEVHECPFEATEARDTGRKWTQRR